MYSEKHHGEMMPADTAALLTHLPFGVGRIGSADALEDSLTAETAFAAQLTTCIQPITHPKTADCVDERRTIALGDGTDDPRLLEARIAHQLPGGLVLAVTKAATAADLSILRDADGFQAAYETMHTLLTALGYEDGGHKDCGASKLVEASVADELPRDMALATLPAFRPTTGRTPELLAANWQAKRQRLEAGFYGRWSKGWHEDFLSSRVPHNFSILAEDASSLTNGHNGEALLLISQAGMGFNKNRFAEHREGRGAFAATTHSTATIVHDIMSQIGGSQRERERFLLEFDDDAPQVMNQLVAKGFPVFGQTA